MDRGRRLKLVFVISQLVQGGSERYLFELCRALNPSRFEVEILFRQRPRKSDYYYWKLKELGFTIHTQLPIRRNFARLFPRLAKTRVWKGAEDAVFAGLLRLQLSSFFDRYDVINIIQIENYHHLRDFLRGDPRKVVYLMSNGFQYDHDIYAACNRDEHHHFVIMDPDQEQDLARSETDFSYEVRYFPLLMDFTEHPRIEFAPPVGSDPVHIGCFIRLSTERPLEPLFHCFERLVRTRDAVLHVYGSGDPSMFIPMLDRLGIRDRVVFEGHQVDMRAAVVRDGVSIVWMTCHGVVLGYASLEVASFGIPMVFWNLSSTPHVRILEATAGAVHAFTAPEDVARFTDEMIKSPDQMTTVGGRLRDWVVTERDINSQIHVLEEYLVEVASRERPGVTGDTVDGSEGLEAERRPPRQALRRRTR